MLEMEIPERKPVGAKLKATLKALGETQQWLANRSGYDKATVSRVLNDKVPPTEPQLRAILEAMGESFDAYVPGTSVEGMYEPQGPEAQKQLRDQNMRLIKALEDLRVELADMEAEAEVTEAKLKTALDLSEGLEAQLTDMTRQRNAYEEDLRREKAKLTYLESHNTELKNTLSARARQITELKKQVSNLTNMLAVAGLGVLITGGIAASKS